jgi:hypothetical protein
MMTKLIELLNLLINGIFYGFGLTVGYKLCMWLFVKMHFGI